MASLLAIAGAADARGFPVGITTRTFTKRLVTTGAPRDLATLIWYPAVSGTGTPEAFGLRDARPRRRRSPLIVFSHGTCGRPTEASYFTMALASRGFIVVAPSHVGDTADDFPACLSPAAFVDSAINRVPDVRFVIDAMLAVAADASSPLAGRLRTTAIGVSGLSFGGFTTLWTAQQEPRVRAALAMVPGGTAALGAEKITTPTMVIGAEHDQVVGFAESEAAYRLLGGPRFLVELKATSHLSVTDACAPICGADDVSQERAHRLVLRWAVPFFERYLARAAVRVPRAGEGAVVTHGE